MTMEATSGALDDGKRSGQLVQAGVAGAKAEEKGAVRSQQVAGLQTLPASALESDHCKPIFAVNTLRHQKYQYDPE
jgi:hypothetical protein